MLPLQGFKLPLVGVVQGKACRIGSSWHCGDLDGGGDFDVHGRVLATSPVRHQNISWAPVVTRKEEATLLNWSEACGNCSFKNCIRRGVVSTDAFSPRATAECVVAIESVESLTAV